VTCDVSTKAQKSTTRCINGNFDRNRLDGSFQSPHQLWLKLSVPDASNAFQHIHFFVTRILTDFHLRIGAQAQLLSALSSFNCTFKTFFNAKSIFQHSMRPFSCNYNFYASILHLVYVHTHVDRTYLINNRLQTRSYLPGDTNDKFVCEFKRLISYLKLRHGSLNHSMFMNIRLK
jgi:hypothetical protein